VGYFTLLYASQTRQRRENGLEESGRDLIICVSDNG
jgi:hypothetical protein